MRTILHLLTRPPDEFARELLERQKTLPEMRVEVVDLCGKEPDYDDVVKKVFAAESIAVW